MLLAALAGGLAVGVAVFVFGASTRRPTSTTPSVTSAPVSTATRRDASSTALSATEIYQRDSTGVVVIKAVTADGEDRARASSSTTKA